MHLFGWKAFHLLCFILCFYVWMYVCLFLCSFVCVSRCLLVCLLCVYLFCFVCLFNCLFGFIVAHYLVTLWQRLLILFDFWLFTQSWRRPATAQTVVYEDLCILFCLFFLLFYYLFSLFICWLRCVSFVVWIVCLFVCCVSFVVLMIILAEKLCNYTFSCEVLTLLKCLPFLFCDMFGCKALH